MLIAEIGSNHWGSMPTAKALIAAAMECGASVVKGQAYRSEDIKGGSMPFEFYDACALSEDQCLELLGYARDIGIEMFFSIFSPGYDRLRAAQAWHKVAGGQFENGIQADWKDRLDTPRHIVSVKKESLFRAMGWERAQMLYVTPYMVEVPELENIDKLSQICGRQAGLSDHSIGIHYAIEAAKRGARVIEKHFCLEKNYAWRGQIYRDTVHGADPKELKLLAKSLEKIWTK
jgi:N,N'-diacetyllegionaminate synthase